MINLSCENLCMPYNQQCFIDQLRDAGIPKSSISSMQLNHLKEQPNESLLFWLYSDILANETRIVNG